MTTDDGYDPLQTWARAKSELRDASYAVMVRLGMTWDDLNKLEVEAMSAMGDRDVVETQWGFVQKIPDRPVQYRIRKIAEDVLPTIFKSRLRLSIKEE